ncbi:hypothetical protein AVEN_226141-1 [Araneus ventricosus]|uniref:RNase H type-1 domain-containing protein n=1 Tax=Araneus ventricosus TaxID=182803 RepID=A0A4Y2Q8A4_ARAVE|nr:hypothetical protein AVEN_226141-1 [Araneus ventricosus]
MVRSPKITWNGYKINRVKSFKYLGIHVGDRLNWLEHINKQGEKAIKMQQNLKRIAGGNWGISQIHRWTLYKMVIERMLVHGSSAWCLNPTFKMKRKLSSIQRPFLLQWSRNGLWSGWRWGGAYRTTPASELQTILDIPPLHIQLQFEARFTSIYRLRIPLPPIITDTQPHDLEMKATGWSTNPSEHLKLNQFSFEDGEAYIDRKDIINIFTDGSKSEHGVGAAFCVLTNDIWAYQWSAILNDNNTVFQAELTALHEAVIYASHLPNHNTSEIHVDNRASIMASFSSKSTNETARKIFKILLSNPRIKVSWFKVHAGNIGNGREDQLAKDATQHGQPYSHTKLPKPHIKGLLRKRMLEEWQTSWKNGNTCRKIYNIMPSVSLRPTNWIREDVIFSQHRPFPAYLKRFHLSDSDYCSCGGVGTALHYVTECIYTVSWHMRKPAPNFEQEWLKRVANNLVSKQKIRGIIKFISENRDLFGLPSLQLPSELN